MLFLNDVDKYVLEESYEKSITEKEFFTRMLVDFGINV